MKNNTYIIAEVGVNHENSMEKAIELIDLAKNERRILEEMINFFEKYNLINMYVLN